MTTTATTPNKPGLDLAKWHKFLSNATTVEHLDEARAVLGKHRFNLPGRERRAAYTAYDEKVKALNCYWNESGKRHIMYPTPALP